MAHTGRPDTEFWQLTPTQTLQVFEALGIVQRRGNANDLARKLGLSGVKIKRE